MRRDSRESDDLQADGLDDEPIPSKERARIMRERMEAIAAAFWRDLALALLQGTPLSIAQRAALASTPASQLALLLGR